MPSIFDNPTDEMRRFAGEHGGLADNFDRQITADRNLAHEYIDLLAECYYGSQNAYGESFSIGAQNCASMLRNGLFTKRNQQSLILYNEGLMRLIDEIALLCVIAQFRDFKQYKLADYFHLFGQSSWRGVGMLEAYDTQKIRSLVQHLSLEREHIDFANVLTNFMLLFVLSHEFSHAVNGHSVLLNPKEPLAFLGETTSSGITADVKWSLVAEMSADYVALQHLLSICTKDPFKSSQVSVDTQMSCMIASILMLFSYWFIEGFEISGHSFYHDKASEIDLDQVWNQSHPISTDRIALLLSSMYDQQFASRLGLQKLGSWTDEAFALSLEGFPEMVETTAIGQIHNFKTQYLDRAFAQKQYLAKSTLSEFQQKAGQFKFPKLRTIQWD